MAKTPPQHEKAAVNYGFVVRINLALLDDPSMCYVAHGKIIPAEMTA